MWKEVQLTRKKGSHVHFVELCPSSSDEQIIVPFKARASMNQYNPKKPNMWGYKIFFLLSLMG